MAIRSVVAALTSVLGIGWMVRAARGVPSALGAPISAIAPYAAGATTYRDRRFHNSEPSSQIVAGSAGSLALSLLTRRTVGRPRGTIPVRTPRVPRSAADLALTWYGHATTLIEVDGYRILTDPVWSERVSPSPLIGPARMHRVPQPLSDLPVLDAVIISHDHYDHLDRDTVCELVARQRAPLLVPIGIGAHLRRWGVPQDRIIELDWGGSVSLSDLGLTSSNRDLAITCTEARHFSGRGLQRNTTLWASWSIVGPTHRVYFGGDTGYTKAFADVGAALGPFDLTLLPIGAYDERWPDVHMNPEEAVRAHADLCVGDSGHGLLAPIHWATFNLAFHRWSEPVERMTTAARAVGTTVAVPMPGQRVDVMAAPADQAWWESVD
ncbi:MBL fold metallo-hydrolase [Nocardia sp. CNY236]|uniref:MBL fold metallo-hydrolase n=1 Tax=Nocardia sp. CNY236 TaxID=1169152 RepID=UPI0005616FCF|nr:MBL fold metallo-hydrolase [Nocardia sp. CNY236]